MNNRALTKAFACVLAILTVGLLVGHTQAAPHRVEVHVKRFAFTPNEATVKRGEPVLLVLSSEDANHGLRFRQLNIDLRVNKGNSAQVQFTPDITGDFVGHCSVFCGSGHGGMTFTLHVVN